MKLIRWGKPCHKKCVKTEHLPQWHILCPQFTNIAMEIKIYLSNKKTREMECLESREFGAVDTKHV